MKHLNSLYSLEDELFAAPAKPKRPGWWKWAFAIFLCALFIYRSTRPVMRLAAEPPPSFYDFNRRWDHRERQNQRRVAQAYWHIAVQRIQARYSPQKPLPAVPPPQFRISDAARALESDVIGSRVHYWTRLRAVWNEQDAWDISYGWSTDWVASSLNSLAQSVPGSVAGAFQSLANLFADISQRISYP